MISVVVPTFNRPQGLKVAVESVFAQTLTASGFELVIVDNTPDATAAEMIANLEAACPPSIRFIALHEPAAGVANARNTAMSAVSSDLVAFLDDDQSAPENWLEKLLENYRAYPAAVTFGPVITRLPEGHRRHQDYFEGFFARDPDLASGYIEDSFGCGNALIDFARIDGGAPWFDTQMNEIGGEDDLLFQRVRRSKAQFAWAAEAGVSEYPVPERVTLNYTLRRAFSYGQAPITLARRGGRKRFDLVLAWMLVGLGKTALHGTQWVALSLIRHPNRAFQLDLAVRGISKIFWWIDLRFYGEAALKQRRLKAQRPKQSAFSVKAERAS
jgi:glycosyltransferase involved in cell wall biosynthesis